MMEVRWPKASCTPRVNEQHKHGVDREQSDLNVQQVLDGISAAEAALKVNGVQASVCVDKVAKVAVAMHPSGLVKGLQQA
jgi:hypothetical protein